MHRGANGELSERQKCRRNSQPLKEWWSKNLKALGKREEIGKTSDQGRKNDDLASSEEDAKNDEKKGRENLNNSISEKSRKQKEKG